MIAAPLGRYIRYWYTYRTAVAVVIALALTGVMFWLYTQQLACDEHQGCYINLSVHPEDRFATQYDPGSNITIVGIDDASVQRIGQYPISREKYALALTALEEAGAQVVAFDVGFTDPRDPTNDGIFARTLGSASIPVILAYGSGSAEPSDGKIVQKGVDEIPLKKFRCADSNSDSNVGCTDPYPNVILASTDLPLDQDGVVRRIPLAVQPACFAKGSCSTPTIDSLGVAAYRAFTLGKDFRTGPDVQVTNGTASFGQAWNVPTDRTGSILINFSGPPGNFANYSHYLDFASVLNGTFDRSQVQGKIVFVGYYKLTGVNDEQLVPTSFGLQTTAMQGVEINANVASMLTALPPKFLIAEPPWVLLLLILVLSLATAVGVARVTVLWGLLGTLVALVLFTFGMSALAAFQGWVPDLFHPWLAIALTYSGVTAYRFLYENREKRKVTALFGQYLKPEIVAQLAKTRGGVADIMRGGERRDVTLMFVDIRGFTSMSESMSAHDVTEVVQMYLDHLSGIIFDWDGTVDKYVGDEIVAFWNAPREQGNHALLALRCAYDLINRGPELQQRLLAKGLPPIRWGIGINSGPAVVGNMGSRSRLQYTALGDTVNTAARFCSHAPAFQVLIGQETYEMCQDYIAVDLIPGVQLKGKSAEKFRIYEVTAIREATDKPWVQFPTQLATQAHQTFTSQYTQQTVLAASETGSSEILVGDEAEEMLAHQPEMPG